MSYFNSNITGGSGGSGGASGLVTKFLKTIAISSSELAEVTIDISSDISNYKDITNDRIIVELNDASAIAAGDTELTHTYDAETGIITITSTNSSIPFASSSAVELSVNVYVAGAVQLPPKPEYNGYEVVYNNVKSTYNSSINDSYSIKEDGLYMIAAMFTGRTNSINTPVITKNAVTVEYASNLVTTVSQASHGQGTLQTAVIKAKAGDGIAISANFSSSEDNSHASNLVIIKLK